MPVTVRRAGAADADTIVDFNCLLAEESEGKTLERALLLPGVRAGLLDDMKIRYYVAEDAGRVVGQMGTTLEWSDWRNGWFWWIQSVYVRPEARRRGVFRALYEHVLRAAQADPQVIGLRLYVEEENRAAQQTYERLGMEKTGYFVLERYPL
jgi:ribosomal protein S18 acetylase RimI-like enzyme